MRERQHGQSEYDWINAVAFPLKCLVNIRRVLLQRHQIQTRGKRMGLKIKLIAFRLGLSLVLAVFRSVRRSLFRPAYAVMWIAMSVFLLLVSVWEPLHKWLDPSVLGIEDARHIICVAMIGFLPTHLFCLTAMASRRPNQNRMQQLISEVAIYIVAYN
jgi:hypothetical protein